MNGLSLCLCLLHIRSKVAKRTRFINTHHFALFLNRWLITHPYDVVDGQFVAKNDFLVIIDIDHSS